jgi:hypothetical protein
VVYYYRIQTNMPSLLVMILNFPVSGFLMAYEIKVDIVGATARSTRFFGSHLLTLRWNHSHKSSVNVRTQRTKQ